LVEKFRKQHGVDLIKEGDRITQQRLNEASRNAKHELSNVLETEINLPFIFAKGNTPLNMQLTITRKEFEEITKDLTDSAIRKTKEVLRDSKLSINEIQEVLLVGGSTRMPIISELLQKEFNKTPNKNIDPDEVVAIGAGIQGAVLAGTAEEDIVLIDATSLSFGIKTENGINTIMIPRNTRIPTSKKETFSTAVDYQKEVYIEVNQGERTRADDNKQLGTFRLEIKNPRKRGIPQIEVEFAIDSNGILSVSAEDKGSGEKQSITIQGAQSLSREEIEEMIRKAEENKAKDNEIKENIEALNRAQAYVYTFSEQIEGFKKHENFKEDDEQFQEFQNSFNDLKEVTDKKDFSKIKENLSEEKIKKLFELSSSLMKKMPPKEDDNSNNKEEVVDVSEEEK